MNELSLKITREDFNRIRRGMISQYPLAPEDLHRVYSFPTDYDRIKFNYKTRSLFRDYEGIDPDGTLHIGDKCRFSRG